jgi:sulfotransferase family protein
MAQENTRVRVVYIGGCTRSGSTLIDRALGTLRGFASTGEFGLLTTQALGENRLCGCGQRFLDCAFWQSVGERAFGGWDSPEVRELIDLHPRLTRNRQIPLVLSARVLPTVGRRLRRYRQLLGRVYAAVADISGADVVVDSTKAPAYALILRGVPGLDMRVVHLVRDSRGTAYSAGKRFTVKDSVDRTVWKHRYPPVVITLRWLLYHQIFATLDAMDRRGLLVRYEDFVRNPRQVLGDIARFAGRDLADHELAFATPMAIQLGPSHTIAGNDMRFDTGPVPLREDDEWKRSLAIGARRLVTAMSWPLLRRWDYL